MIGLGSDKNNPTQIEKGGIGHSSYQSINGGRVNLILLGNWVLLPSRVLPYWPVCSESRTQLLLSHKQTCRDLPDNLMTEATSVQKAAKYSNSTTDIGANKKYPCNPMRWLQSKEGGSWLPRDNWPLLCCDTELPEVALLRCSLFDTVPLLRSSLFDRDLHYLITRNVT